MQFSIIFKFIGLLLMLFSFSQLPPILIDLLYQQQEVSVFLITFAITFLTGFVVWSKYKSSKERIRIREGVLLVVSSWLVLSIFATLPFMLTESLKMSLTNAFFESVSGLSTTGGTVISNLDELPKAILYYRQQLQWIGGMGIIVFAVAILPMIGVGGAELFHDDVNSISQERLTPKLAQTAKSLWFIYLGLTLACIVAYFFAGMNWFDAISHSFSTIAIGGFSTHNASIGYFDSVNVEIVSMIFMILSGVNFSLHFVALQNKKISSYLADSEFKIYILMLTFLIIITAIVLIINNSYPDIPSSIRHGAFQVISFVTTTGFISGDIGPWPVVLPALLMIFSCVGGCAGSTAGGIKVVRILLMFKLGAKEIKKIIHPSAQINIKLNKNQVPTKVLISVWGFFALYIAIFIFIMLLLMFSGLDQVTSFSATAANINNLGQALGDASQNYKNINDFSKWVLSFAMLLGRLEILALLAILHRSFWRY